MCVCVRMCVSWGAGECTDVRTYVHTYSVHTYIVHSACIIFESKCVYVKKCLTVLILSFRCMLARE